MAEGIIGGKGLAFINEPFPFSKEDVSFFKALAKFKSLNKASQNEQTAHVGHLTNGAAKVSLTDGTEVSSDPAFRATPNVSRSISLSNSTVKASVTVDGTSYSADGALKSGTDSSQAITEFQAVKTEADFNSWKEKYVDASATTVTPVGTAPSSSSETEKLDHGIRQEADGQISATLRVGDKEYSTKLPLKDGVTSQQAAEELNKTKTEADFNAWKDKFLTSAAPTTPPATTDYVVVAGDSLSAIAAAKGISVQDIATANGNRFPNPESLDLIYTGETLKIPAKAALTT